MFRSTIALALLLVAVSAATIPCAVYSTSISVSMTQTPCSSYVMKSVAVSIPLQFNLTSMSGGVNGMLTISLIDITIPVLATYPFIAFNGFPNRPTAAASPPANITLSTINLNAVVVFSGFFPSNTVINVNGGSINANGVSLSAFTLPVTPRRVVVFLAGTRFLDNSSIVFSNLTLREASGSSSMAFSIGNPAADLLLLQNNVSLIIDQVNFTAGQQFFVMSALNITQNSSVIIRGCTSITLQNWGIEVDSLTVHMGSQLLIVNNRFASANSGGVLNMGNSDPLNISWWSNFTISDNVWTTTAGSNANIVQFSDDLQVYNFSTFLFTFMTLQSANGGRCLQLRDLRSYYSSSIWMFNLSLTCQLALDASDVRARYSSFLGWSLWNVTTTSVGSYSIATNKFGSYYNSYLSFSNSTITSADIAIGFTDDVTSTNNSYWEMNDITVFSQNTGVLATGTVTVSHMSTLMVTDCLIMVSMTSSSAIGFSFGNSNSDDFRILNTSVAMFLRNNVSSHDFALGAEATTTVIGNSLLSFRNNTMSSNSAFYTLYVSGYSTSPAFIDNTSNITLQDNRFKKGKVYPWNSTGGGSVLFRCNFWDNGTEMTTAGNFSTTNQSGKVRFVPCGAPCTMTLSCFLPYVESFSPTPLSNCSACPCQPNTIAPFCLPFTPIPQLRQPSHDPTVPSVTQVLSLTRHRSRTWSQSELLSISNSATGTITNPDSTTFSGSRTRGSGTGALSSTASMTAVVSHSRFSDTSSVSFLASHTRSWTHSDSTYTPGKPYTAPLPLTSSNSPSKSKSPSSSWSPTPSLSLSLSESNTTDMSNSASPLSSPSLHNFQTSVTMTGAHSPTSRVASRSTTIRTAHAPTLSLTITLSITYPLAVPDTVTPLAQTTQSVAKGAIIASIVTTSPTGATNMARLTSMQAVISCDLQLDVNEAVNLLAVTFGPVDGEQARGAVVGNMGLLLACLSLLAVVFIGVKLLSQKKVSNQRALALIHCPGAAVMPISAMLQPTLTGAVALLFIREWSGDVALGVIILVLAAAYGALITYWLVIQFPCVLQERDGYEERCSKLAAKSASRALVYRLLVSSERWTYNTNPEWKRQFLPLFDEFRKPWYMFLDVIASLFIGVMSGIPKESKAICTAQAVVFLVVYLLLFVCLFFKPFLNRISFLFAVVMNTIGLVAAIVLTVHQVRPSMITSAAAVIQSCALCMSGVGLLKTVVDLLSIFIGAVKLVKRIMNASKKKADLKQQHMDDAKPLDMLQVALHDDVEHVDQELGSPSDDALTVDDVCALAEMIMEGAVEKDHEVAAAADKGNNGMSASDETPDAILEEYTLLDEGNIYDELASKSQGGTSLLMRNTRKGASKVEDDLCFAYEMTSRD